ncbi:MAG TPA: SpoVR family protein [Planctomycetaceae bacterium]|nr:SpoVR family protein [Planctomycetaceae bacterium]
MPISIQRPLPQEIADVQKQMSSKAREYGLDFFETIFEVVDYDEMSMLAAFGGFPVRYPHWRFGAEFDELSKGYEYGLQKIYEMVINTNPCYAYLLKSNSMMDQKLVIAHVYGHCDFFKNNAWFKPTNRRMLDEMANHAARINRYIDRHGHEAVESFIDACLSLEDLVDPHSPHICRRDAPAESIGSPIAKEADEARDTPGKFASKDYMDDFINPQEALLKAQKEQDEKQKKKEQPRNFPPEPERDVLLFLLEHAPLKPWQHDVLEIIRDEAYYFAPQGQTKIMNEGWASYWHSTIMTTFGLTDGEVVDYADHHSGTMAMSPNRLNPYKIGIELYRDIEERWDKGQFGPQWDDCDNIHEKITWNKQLGLGREKIFEVRRIHNDVTFIDAFLTPEFCFKHKLFSFAFNDSNNTYEIASRQFQEIKQQLLTSLANHGRPFIYVVDGNYKNRGELFLRHKYQGAELKHDYARDTLANLQRIWGRPVHIDTVVDDKTTVISYDGTNHDIKQK